MTQPGVGPNTALAYVLTIGDVSRFQRGKQVASYLGLIPREESSGGRQKLGCDHQARQPHAAFVAGGSGADRGAATIPDYEAVFASLSSEAEGSGQGGNGAQVSGTTLLDAAHQVAYPEIVRIESSSRVPLVGAS